MSFSFRNIFSPEDGNDGGGVGKPHDPINDPPRAGQKGAFSGPTKSGEGGRSQAFLVNEILPFIPPAIAAQSGIPMEQEVRIPLPADGSTDVKLSTIFQTCPQLFAAEITPLNDSTVTLPAKLGSMPEPPPTQSSPLTPGAAFGRPVAPQNTPQPSASSGPKEENPEDNPFWSPEEPTSTAGPNESNSRPTQPPASQDSSPMQNSSDNPFGNKNSHPGKGAPGSGSSPSGAMPHGFSSPSPKGPVGGAGQTDGNPFAKEQPPTPAQPSVPEAEENPFVSDEGFSSLFSRKAEEDQQIPFPSTGTSTQAGRQESDDPGSWGNLFTKSPDQSAPSGMESMGNMMGSGAQAGGSAQTPPVASAQQFAPIEDEEDYGDFLPPVANVPLPAVFDTPEYATESTEEEESEPVFGEDLNPFADESAQAEPPKSIPEEAPVPSRAEPPSAPSQSATPTEPTQGTPQSGFDKLAPLGGFQSAQQPDMAQASPESRTSAIPAQRDPESVPDEEPKQSGDGASVPKPAPIRESVSASKPEPEISEPEVVFEEPAEAPSAVSPAPMSSAMGLPMVDDSGEIRDIELRAIFSTSEDFTMRKVARRVVTLEGITSCALATPGKLVQASRTEESRIGDEAKEMVTTIRSLAKLTGMPEARCFTLHTDKGIVSIFLEGECCVTVHHESTSFGPGVREKLILIARSLEKLEE